MKFLILGCNGMAGHLISLYLQEQGHDVLGLARSKSCYVPSVAGDVRDTALLRQLLEQGSYDAVINAVGILNQFAERDKATAAFINGYLPHFLAQTTAQMPTRIIHMSTDCVFSGKEGGYTETSFPDASSFYGRSKALGELNDEKNLTIRSSIIGPDIKPMGIGLVNWFMQQTGTIQGYTGAIWSGQTTLQLAKTMEAAVRAGVTGLHHLVPEETISKYELLRLCNEMLRQEPVEIKPVVGICEDKSLTRTNYSFQYTIPSYETMIAEMYDWMSAHRAMYPHYAIK